LSECRSKGKSLQKDNKHYIAESAQNQQQAKSHSLSALPQNSDEGKLHSRSAPTKLPAELPRVRLRVPDHATSDGPGHNRHARNPNSGSTRRRRRAGSSRLVAPATACVPRSGDRSPFP